MTQAAPAGAEPFSGSGAETRRWYALALLFLTQMLSVGSISYGFSVLLKPLAADFGLPRGVINLGLMAVMVGMAAFAPFVGRALDHLSGRLIVMAGAVLFGAGWAGVALSANAAGALLAAFFLLSLGATALGPVVALTLVSRWFVRQRGLALGVASVATSMGGFIIVPLLAFLIESNGWRDAMLMYGVSGAALILALSILILPSVRPAAPTLAQNAHTAPDATQAPWRQRDFWLITGAIGIIMGANGALLSCIVAHATDRGFTLAQGTALISVMSGAAILGKVALGILSDRIDPRWLFLGVAMLNSMMFAVLLAQPAYPVLLAAALLTGPALGGAMPVWTVIVGRRFGLAQMGRAMGLMSAATLPLTLGGLQIIGALFDATGNYRSAFFLFLIAVGVAGLLILPVRGSERAEAQTA